MTIPLDYNDEDLLRQMLAGDEEAFTTIYRRRQGGIYRFALQMCGSPSIAEDVTQEVFMILIREEARRYDPSRGPLAAYLYGIARNCVLRYLERDHSHITLADRQEDTKGRVPEKLIAENDPLDDFTKNEIIERVRRAVLKLPAHYREVVVLCDLHELGYADAALVLGCAVGTVRSRLHRARALLMEKLRASEEPDPAAHTFNPTRCLA